MTKTNSLLLHPLARAPMRQNWLFNASKRPHNLKEFIDYDPAFIASLSPEQQAYLHQFLDNFYTGARNELSKDFAKEEYKKSYDRNNSRIRDRYNHQIRCPLNYLPSEKGTKNDA